MEAGVEAGVAFRSSAAEGAILFLPSGATRYDAGDLPAFRNYIHRHAVSWHDFYRGRVLDNENSQENSLYLITGFIKCKTWWLASFSENSEGRDLHLQLSAPISSANVTISSNSTNYHGVMSRVWSEKNVPENVGDLPSNHSPFISGYKIHVRKRRLEVTDMARPLNKWDRMKRGLVTPFRGGGRGGGPNAGGSGGTGGGGAGGTDGSLEPHPEERHGNGEGGGSISGSNFGESQGTGHSGQMTEGDQGEDIVIADGISTTLQYVGPSNQVSDF